VEPLLTGAPTGDEEAVAARHGAGHLAAALVAARAVVDQGPWPDRAERTAAIVGLGIGAAVQLREAPMPAAYAAAQLEKIRAEYRLPRGGYGSTPPRHPRRPRQARLRPDLLAPIDQPDSTEIVLGAFKCTSPSMAEVTAVGLGLRSRRCSRSAA
jgi:hypothetical protein